MLFVRTDFVFGSAYILTTDILKPLLDAAARRRAIYFPLEDVFTTGFLRAKIGARLQSWNEFYVLSTKYGPAIPSTKEISLKIGVLATDPATRRRNPQHSEERRYIFVRELDSEGMRRVKAYYQSQNSSEPVGGFEHCHRFRNV